MYKRGLKGIPKTAWRLGLGRMAALFLVLCFVFGSVCVGLPARTVRAETGSETGSGSETGADSGASSAAESLSLAAVAQTVSTASAAVVLMEPESGTILYSKGAMDTHYPASITKLMTALLAMEHCDPQEIVTFSKDAVYKCEGETSNIARDVGEEMTMEHCLYGMLLASANECAYAIAEHICDGDVDAFAQMMNEKAAELGCLNTHFANPNGLHQADHTTCAYDMALIARAVWRYELIRTIMGTRYYLIPPTNKHDEETPLNNTHYMINYYKTNQYLYEYCVGGKTGYTPEAHSTLVTFAEKGGMTLIAVVMDVKAPEQYQDTRRLFDAFYDNTALTRIAGTDSRILDAVSAAAADGSFAAGGADIAAEGPLSLVLPKGVSLDDVTFTARAMPASEMADLMYYYRNGDAAGLPYLEENAVGRVDVSWQGETLGSAVLWYTKGGSYDNAEAAEAEEGESAAEEAEGAEDTSSRFSLQALKDRLPKISLKLPKLSAKQIVILIIILLVVAVVLFFVSFWIYVQRKRRRRRRRMRKINRSGYDARRKAEERRKNERRKR